MSRKYSLYEAKAKLSSLVRMVREGRTVVITVHGKPAAEMRPIPDKPLALEERIAQLEAAGVIIPARGKRQFKPVAKRRGALARFLAERD